MTRILVLALAAVLLTGCTLGQVADHAVNRYCAIPQPAREANRLLINTQLAPNAIAITCAQAPVVAVE